MDEVYTGKVEGHGEISLPVVLMQDPIVYITPVSDGYLVRSEDRFSSLNPTREDERRLLYALSEQVKIEFGKLRIPKRMRRNLRVGQKVTLEGDSDLFRVSVN